MSSKIAKWWNDEEQTLLRHETARALRFFCSKTGLLLIVMQCILVFWPAWQSVGLLIRTGLGFSGISMVVGSLYGALVAPLIYNIVWLWLFHEFVIKRFRGASREELLVTPLTPRMLWPAMLAIPLIWCGIAAAIQLARFPFLLVNIKNVLPFSSTPLIISVLVSRIQHMLLPGLITWVSARYLNNRMNIARLCGILLATYFVVSAFRGLVHMLSMNLTVTIIKALNFQSPVQLWSEFRSWLYLSTQLFMVLLLFYLNVLFLKKLRRKKGLEAFVEEEITRRPSSVVSSQGGY
jgi:hypothetical protein